MNNSNKISIEKLRIWSEGFCSENGLFLVKIEETGKKIEIFADSFENITIEQCRQLSKYLQGRMEEETDLLEHYTLDVSSPGAMNPLILPIQYKKRLNKDLSIELTDGKKYDGLVKEVDEKGIVVEVTIPKNKKLKQEEEIIQYNISYQSIKKAIIPLPIKFKKK